MNRSGWATAAPFQRNSPAWRGSNPSSTLSSVVLPAPMRPVTTVNDPRARVRSISLMPAPPAGCR